MDNIAGDARYEVSYRSAWGGGDGPLGHVVIRRLDDHSIVAEVPVDTEEQARDLLARAEDEVRGSAAGFERTWGLVPVDAPPPAPHLPPGAEEHDEDRDLVEGEPVLVGDPRVRVLPDPAEVFSAEQPWLARLLHPLVSIELSALDPAWTGRVHLLSPVEPEEGLLGEETSAHHDDHAGENWISFRLDDEGRYTFLGQRRFFAIEAEEADGGAASGLTETYAEAAAQFAGTRVRWEALGALVWGDPQDPTRQREGWGSDIALVDELGGEPGYGNWASFPPPAAFVLDEADPVTPVLRLADGRPFTFVAATSGYPWRDHGADAILVFFEPQTRTVALTFDWT